MPMCDDIITLSLNHLRNPVVERDTKPIIISTIGDIALAIGGGFLRYFPYITGMIKEAGAVVIIDKDLEDIDYLNTLRSAVIDVYVGIIHGLKQGNKTEHLLTIVDQMVQFILVVCNDQDSGVTLLSHLVGLVGDIFSSVGHKAGVISKIMQNEPICAVIERCKKSGNATISRGAIWAEDMRDLAQKLHDAK